MRYQRIPILMRPVFVVPSSSASMSSAVGAVVKRISIKPSSPITQIILQNPGRTLRQLTAVDKVGALSYFQGWHASSARTADFDWSKYPNMMVEGPTSQRRYCTQDLLPLVSCLGYFGGLGGP